MVTFISKEHCFKLRIYINKMLYMVCPINNKTEFFTPSRRQMGRNLQAIGMVGAGPYRFYQKIELALNLCNGRTGIIVAHAKALECLYENQ